VTSLKNFLDPDTTSTMADMMWGGVPFTIPSSTAMKYISGAVKVQREANLPIGGHYNARQTMERELLGHRQSRLDRVESYETYDRIRRNGRSESRAARQSMVKEMSLGPENEYKSYCRRSRLGYGLGSSQPRMEHIIGCVDRRKTLPGYIGGIKIRDSVFRDSRL